MYTTPVRYLVTSCLLIVFSSFGYSQTEGKTATVKILVPESPTRTSVTIDGQPTKSTGDTRTFITPPLQPGKTYAYKIVATIEPNNYTKIFRTREVTFKAGDEVTVDLRNKDDKIKDDVHIRWVPTPDDIVEKMCELAKIKEGDIVADPGCGDGILVLTALKKYKAAKAYAFDIDPKKIEETKENAKKAGLQDKVVARLQNCLELKKDDLKDVTVLMTYMGDELNIRLRPILWENMKPGSRIVSHRFIFGDWKPDKTITVMGADGDEYTLHVWTITGKEIKGDYPKTRE